MYSLDDTIVAISTPIGQSGIGIVRLSGPEALAVAYKLFRRHGQGRLSPGHLQYGHVHDPETERLVDEALLAYMRAPHSYTRQDVVEIQAHGGHVPLREILALCLRHGARLAQPGEFTLRAFLNGRLDLAQAEAVLDVITARTPAALRSATAQLGGHFSGRVQAIRNDLLRTRAYLEARADFPDEDIPFEDITPSLRSSERALLGLAREAGQGMLYRLGVRAAIVGRPNVGKSSLLNCLLRAERAIVTPYPGTTRDTIEETLDLQGIPLVLVDTAGIGESADPVERLGIERSQRSATAADLILLVLDASQAPGPHDERVLADIPQKPTVLVLNKCDLGVVPQADTWHAELPRFRISALLGDGLDELERGIAAIALGSTATPDKEPGAGNPRHVELLRQALVHVRDALQARAHDLPDDLIAIDLSAATEALGQITGETADDELLATIFANFCIGK